MISIDDLKVFLPNYFTIINKNDNEYQNIIGRYLIRLKDLNCKNSSDIIKPHCLLDWVNLAKKGDNEAKFFISFIDEQANVLAELLRPNFLKKIKEMLWKTFSSIEIDTSKKENPDYLNHLAELFGLNHILTTGDDIFILIQIEKELPNGRRVDFEFQNKRNKEFIHIDFLSIHGIDISKIDKNDDLTRFLEYRLKQKISDKINGLPNNQPTTFHDGVVLNLVILPIIWTEVETLVPYKRVFDDFNKSSNYSLPFCSLLSQNIEGYGKVYKFARVSDIIVTWKMQKCRLYKLIYHLKDFIHKITIQTG